MQGYTHFHQLIVFFSQCPTDKEPTELAFSFILRYLVLFTCVHFNDFKRLQWLATLCTVCTRESNVIMGTPVIWIWTAIDDHDNVNNHFKSFKSLKWTQMQTYSIFLIISKQKTSKRKTRMCCERSLDYLVKSEEHPHFPFLRKHSLRLMTPNS